MYQNDYLAERERWNSQTAENSARYAWAWGQVHTLGWGEVVLEEPIMFELTFTDQPTVAYGYTLDDDNQVVDGRLPRCTGGVLRWLRNTNDFYIGAHVFVCVATADPMLAAQAWVQASLEAGAVTVPPDYTDDPGYDITHSFSFAAIAMKDVAS